MLRPRSGSGTAHTAATDTPRRLAGSTNTGCVSFLQTKVRHRVVSGVASSTEECVRLHHRMCPPLLPEEGAAGPAFARLYVVDPDSQQQTQNCLSTRVHEEFDELDETLREHNKVASILERAVQNSNEENKPGFRLVINAIRQIDGSTAHLF